MSDTNITKLEKEIIKIICKITAMEEEEITRNGHLFRDIGIDSIKAIELVVGIQEKYGIKVDDSKIAELTTVALIAQEVKRLLNK
jgi:acyl carrier protein